MGRIILLVAFALVLGHSADAAVSLYLADNVFGNYQYLASSGASSGTNSINRTSNQPGSLLLPGHTYVFYVYSDSQRSEAGTVQGYYSFNFSTSAPITPGDFGGGLFERTVAGSFVGGESFVRSTSVGDFFHEITQARSDGKGNSCSLDAGQATTIGDTSISGNGKTVCQVTGNPLALGGGQSAQSNCFVPFHVSTTTSWSLTGVFDGSFGNGTPGSSPTNPVLPDPSPSGTGYAPHVSAAPRGGWVDPAVTDGYTFSMTSDSLFTKILDFPPGFDSPFTVSVGGQTLGQFSAGDSVDFSSFAGGGVSSFVVSGITPNVDGENPMAFPLQLDYSTSTADFNMTPLPEPGCGCALTLVIASGGLMRRGTAQNRAHPLGLMMRGRGRKP